jgi:hypothetical protein
MKLTLVFVVLLLLGTGPMQSPAPSLSNSYSKVALASVKAIDSDTVTTDDRGGQVMRMILSPLNVQEKTEQEKAMTKLIGQVFDQKESDNRLRAVKLLMKHSVPLNR